MSKLTTKYTLQDIEGMLRAQAWGERFPAAQERGAWDAAMGGALGERRRQWILERARTFAQSPTPPLPAHLFRQYAANGNRVHFETPYFQRRTRMASFVLALCIGGDESLVDPLVDELWAIVEESSWVVPAHAFHGFSPTPLPLPTVEVVFVDLFSAETAANILCASELMRDQLDAVSPFIAQRIEHEVRKRVLDPTMNNDDWWWWTGRNNWTPWICGNVLWTGASLLRDDPAALAKLTHKLMGACDRFIDTYGEDGGCDEGVMYWNVAGAALLVFLEELHRITAGGVDIFDDPLIRAMFAFPARVHLGGGRFPLFADAKPTRNFNRAVLHRAAQRTREPRMAELAWLDARGFDPEADITTLLPHSFNGRDLQAAMFELFWAGPDAFTGPRPAAQQVPEDDPFPDLQWLVSRHETLALAVKGGHNAENHNHNDVGNFTIALDGQWLIVDAGVGHYTAAIFGAQRYLQPFIRSCDHNVPTVNGHEQQAGRAFAARDYHFHRDGARSILTMDLRDVYPPEAGITALMRTLVLDRDARAITLTDRITGPAALNVELGLLCACEPQPDEGGWRLKSGPAHMQVTFPPHVQVEAQRIPLEDELLQKAWRDSLHRLRVQAQGDQTVEYTIHFTAR